MTPPPAASLAVGKAIREGTAAAVKEARDDDSVTVVLSTATSANNFFRLFLPSRQEGAGGTADRTEAAHFDATADGPVGPSANLLLP